MPDLRMFNTDLGRTSLPTRGLLYSVLVHIMFAVATMYVPWSYWIPAEPHLVTEHSVLHEHEALLLPSLDYLRSGAQAAPSSGGGAARPQKKEETADPSLTANSANGMVYKGPQLIVSNPPHPDNSVQTILQPDMVRAPKLPFPLPIPAMVSIAVPKSAPVAAPPQPPAELPHENTPPPKPPLQVANVEPIRLPEQLPKVEVPKLPLSADIPAVAPPTALLNKPVAVPLPKLTHQEQTAATGSQTKNILVVNAVPVPERKPSELPPGELSGAFTVSPVPIAARPLGAIAHAGGGTDAKGGAPGKGGASGGTGGGSGSGAGTGNKSARGNGEGTGAGAGTGTGGTGNGTGTGGHGSGNGSGTGSGSGKGSGPEKGSGNSPFPYITIQGGSSGRSTARTPTTGTAPPQASYGITIIASGASGGGFKDFGVFRDEASYTVYLDMADAGARGSNWTLQYALNSERAAGHSYPTPHGLLVPPYATLKILPHFSSEVAMRGRGGTIVVFAIISPQGHFEDLRIMQSPEAGLNESLLEALKKWTFRPAEMDGGKVPVKVLLGVPVNSVPGE